MNSYDQKWNTAKRTYARLATIQNVVRANRSIAFIVLAFSRRSEFVGVPPRNSRKQERALKFRARGFAKAPLLCPDNKHFFSLFPRYLLESGVSIRRSDHKYNHGLREAPVAFTFPQLKQFNLTRLRVLGPVREYTPRLASCTLFDLSFQSFGSCPSDRSKSRAISFARFASHLFSKRV